MTRDVLSVLMSVALIYAYSPDAVASSQLNFKIYSPGAAGENAPEKEPDKGSSVGATDNFKIYTPPPSSDAGSAAAPTPSAPAAAAPSAPATADAPIAPPTVDAPIGQIAPAAAEAMPSKEKDAATANSALIQPILQSETPETAPATDTAANSMNSTPAKETALTPSEMNAANPSGAPDATAAASAPAASAESSATEGGAADKQQIASKVLQGYVRVVPQGTKIPIIMDTAVDSDTSQEGDEFEARTAEDLDIDGQIAVPAGSVIKGRIAQMNAPKHMMRSGSVALKFDTVTTPDNRQIPLTANLVARGGVVHARRGMKDIAMDTGSVALPTIAGLAIGAVAGNSSSKVGVGGGALIGVGIGAAVGVAVLLARKGTKIDVRPGDELKIELAEDLRMPMM